MRELQRDWYAVRGVEDLPTPALVCYPALIAENIDLVLREAGGVEHLWPHVKTIKSGDILRMMQARGVRRFKCATIAEAEMAARCGAEDILVAYPLVGPNIGRFIRLQETYPDSTFWAIGEDESMIAALGAVAEKAGMRVPLLIDVNIGMNRTGVTPERVMDLYAKCLGLPGIAPKGLHGFSGNFKITDRAARKAAVDASAEELVALRAAIQDRGWPFEALVLSGTPILNCCGEYEDVFLCPGTAFITDMAYYRTFPEYDFVPAAAVLTRVISTPQPGTFTLDLGYKAIAADPRGERGTVLGYEGAETLFQCEEHWTLRANAPRVPRVGEVLTVLPTHICPTITCYPSMWTVEEGRIIGAFEVTARNRSIGV